MYKNFTPALTLTHDLTWLLYFVSVSFITSGSLTKLLLNITLRYIVCWQSCTCSLNLPQEGFITSMSGATAVLLLPIKTKFQQGNVYKIK